MLNKAISITTIFALFSIISLSIISFPTFAQDGTTAEPTNIRAETTETTVTLQWDGPSDDTVLGYIVYEYQNDTCSGAFSVQVTRDSSIAFEGYLPGTTLSYLIESVGEQGERYASSVCVRVTTKGGDVAAAVEPRAPSDVQVTFTGTTATLAWVADEHAVDSEVFLYRDDQCTESLGSSRVGGPQPRFSIEGFPENATYYAAIQSIGEGGVSEPSACIVVSTEQQEVATTIPAAPREVVVSDTAAESVSLSWVADASVTGSEVSLYQDSQCVYPLSRQRAEETQSYTVSGLTPRTTYHFTVRSINAIGIGDPSACVEARTGDGGTTSFAPDAPMNVTVLGVTNSTISLAWDEPRGNGSDIERYRIHKYHGDACTGASVGVDEAVVPSVTIVTAPERLTPGTVYSFQVQAKNEDGQWGERSACVAARTASAAAPDAPENFRSLLVSQTGVHLSWNMPAGGNRLATAYQLYQYEDGLCVHPTGQREYQPRPSQTYHVPNLKPGTTYFFTVRAQNINQWGPVSDCIAVTTEESPTLSTPKRVRVDDRTYDSLTVTWDSDDPIVVSVYSDRSCNQRLQIHSETVEADSASYTITGLTPRTPYSFTLQADNGTKQSAASRCVVAWTASPDAPEVPTNLVVTGTTHETISLSWDEPDGNGAAIDKYHVHKYLGSHCASGSQGLNEVTAPFATIEHAGPSSLQADTTYSFSVNARNSAGRWGERSVCVTATTASAEVPDAPANLRPTDVRKTGLYLSWDRADGNGAVVTTYQLQRYEDSQCVHPVHSKKYLPQRYDYRVEDLEPNTTYYFSVRAENIVGFGDNSDCIAVTTEQTEIPDTPADLAVVDTTPDTILLSWSEPRGNATAIDRYRVFRYSGEGCIYNIGEEETTDPFLSVTERSPDTLYSFRVSARNSGGFWSERSDCVRARTEPPVPPAAPTNVTAVEVADEAISLTWDVPDGMVADAYQVQTYVGADCSVGLSVDTTVTPRVTVTNKGLPLSPGTTYSFVVRARVGELWSEGSTCISATTTAPAVVPDAPRDVRVVVDGTTVTLSWTADETAVDSDLLLYRDSRCTDLVGSTEVGGPQSFIVINGFPEDTRFFASIRSKNAAGVSTPSACTAVGEEDATPSPPQNLSVSDITTDSFALSWTADDTITTNDIRLYRDASCSEEIDRWDIGKATTFTITDLLPNTTYYVAVRSVSGDGVSDPSACVAVSTLSQPVVVPRAPSNILIDRTTATSISLSWSASADATRSELALYTDISCTDLVVRQETEEIQSHTLTGLVPDTTYYLTIRSFSSIGVSGELSSCVIAATGEEESVTRVPDAPRDIQVTVDGSAVTLEWTADDGVIDSDFLLYRDSQCTDSVGSTKVGGSHSFFVINGFPEDVRFFARIQSINALGIGEPSVCFAVGDAGTVAAPPRNLRVSDITTDSFSLSWVTDNGVIANDVLLYQDISCSTEVGRWNTAESSFTITTLQPNTIYSTAVRSVTENGVSEPSTCVAVSTLSQPVSVPPAPESIRMTNATPDSVSVSWTAGANAARSELALYTNATCTNLREKRTTGDPGSYTFVGLSPDTTYYLTIQSFGSTGIAGEVSACVTIATVGQPVVEPSVPRNILVDRVTADSMSLSWMTSANATRSEMALYTNAACTNLSVRQETDEPQSHTITGLVPDTIYYLTVRSFSSTGVAGQASDCIAVATAKEESVTRVPDAPRDIQAVVSDGTATIEWTADDGVTDSTFLLYRDSQCTDSIGSTKVGGPQSFFVINGFPEDVRFFARIQSINTLGIGEPSACFALGGDAGAVAAPPRNLTVSGITADSFVLSWVTDDDVITNEVRLYQDASCSTEVRKWNAASPFTITDLQPNSFYSVVIRSINEHGTSEPSTCVAVSTLSQPTAITPTAPSGLRIAAVTDTSISLSWNVDAVTTRSEVSFYFGGQCGAVLSTLPTEELQSFTITGLPSSVTYSFTVQSINEHGRSESSACVAATTGQRVVEGGQVTNLRSTAVTDTSIAVAWDFSGDVSRVITYDAELFQDRNLCTTASGEVQRGLIDIGGEDVANRTVTVTDLLPNTTYSVRVRAYEADSGWGAYSDCLDVATGSGTVTAPTPPRDLTVSDVTATSFSLSWTADDDATTNTILLYQDIFCSAELRRWNAATPVSVTDLQPNTIYSVAVESGNEGGMSGPSACVAVSTLSQPAVTVPAAPRAITVTDATANSISLSWVADADVARSELALYTNATCTDVLSLRVANDPQSYTLSGLSPDTTYYLTVQSFSTAGIAGEVSACVTVATIEEEPVVRVPAAPRAITVTDVTTDSVSLSWIADADVIQNEIAFYTDAACTNVLTVRATDSSQSYTAIGLLSNATYYLTIQSFSAAGVASEVSSCITVVTAEEEPVVRVPAAPQQVQVAARDSTVSITWNTDDTVTGSEVSFYSDSACANLFTSEQVQGSLSSYTLEASPGSFYFTIRSRNEHGWGTRSACARLEATGDQPQEPSGVLPEAPQNVQIARNANNNTVSVTWETRSTVAGSEVAFYSDSTCTSEIFSQELQDSRSAYTFGATPGFAAHLAVRSRNEHGWGARSACVELTRG